MAYTLNISDGTTTINFLTDLAGGAGYLLNDGGFVVKPLKKKQIWGHNSKFVRGARLLSDEAENRELSIQFQVTGASRNAVTDNLRNIEQLLNIARSQAIKGYGGRVEVKVQLDGSTLPVYWEVLDGNLKYPGNVWSVAQALQRDENSYYLIDDMELVLTVAPYSTFLSPVTGAGSALTITNGGGSENTGLVVWNHEDSGTGHDNWLEVDITDIDGDAPSEIILKMLADATSGSIVYYNVYVGVKKDNLSFIGSLEDDDADFVAGSPTPTSDSASSGGTYSAAQITHSVGTPTNELIRWDLSVAEAANQIGRYRAFGRVKDATVNDWNSNVLFRFKIGNASQNWVLGEWVEGKSGSFLDFGIFDLPPWSPKLSAPDAFSVGIDTYYAVATTETYDIDCVMLIPVDEGHRVYETSGGGTFQDTDTLVDNGWDDVVYVSVGGAGDHTFSKGYLPKIKLDPETKYRLYFLIDTTADSKIDEKLKVILEYIPRFGMVY
jgi:hypothetical protein